jgi:glyoxylase-like metal-dependent hydrolase (beta-lactamase superfamily II)
MRPPDVFGKDTDLTPYFSQKAISRRKMYPSNTILIRSGPLIVVVNPGDYHRFMAAYGPDARPDKHPHPPVAELLRRAGVSRDMVTHVVITHLHYDHFFGVTMPKDGRVVPTFPHAIHLLPRRDMNLPDIAQARAKREKEFVETLGAIESEGLVRLTQGKKNLGREVTVMPSPGESPGHQILLVKSDGRSCYCIGDLYHMTEEVEHHELVASWADRGALLSSRKWFARHAAKESALVLSGHRRPGRITVKRGRPAWSFASVSR